MRKQLSECFVHRRYHSAVVPDKLLWLDPQ